MRRNECGAEQHPTLPAVEPSTSRMHIALTLILKRTSRRRVRRPLIGSCRQILKLGIAHRGPRRLVLIGTVLETRIRGDIPKRRKWEGKMGHGFFFGFKKRTEIIIIHTLPIYVYL